MLFLDMYILIKQLHPSPNNKWLYIGRYFTLCKKGVIITSVLRKKKIQFYSLKILQINIFVKLKYVKHVFYKWFNCTFGWYLCLILVSYKNNFLVVFTSNLHQYEIYRFWMRIMKFKELYVILPVLYIVYVI